MAASQPANFNLQEFTDAGLLLVGGRLYTYAFGTTTQKIAYTDPAGVVPQTYTADGFGGFYIALNARGELSTPLYLASGSYDLTLKRADGSTVWTRRAEGVENTATTALTAFTSSLSASSGSSLVGFLQAGTGAVARTSQDKMRDEVCIFDFMTAAQIADCKSGNPVLDVTGAINSALAAYKIVRIPECRALVAGTINITKDGQKLIGLGSNASKLLFSSTNTVAIQINTNLSNWEISGFSINRNSVAVSGGDGIKMTGSTSQSVVRNMLIEDCWNGISLSSTDFSQIHNVTCQKNRGDGFFFTNTATLGTLQWYVADCLSQYNDGRGYAFVTSAGPTSSAMGELKNCCTYGNTGLGAVFAGSASCTLNGVRIIGGFYGGDGNHEIYLDTYGRGHVVRSIYTELCGQNTTGVANTTPKSNVGSGFFITANNYDVCIADSHANGHSYNGLITEATVTQVNGGAYTNNGLSLAVSNRNGIRNNGTGRLMVTGVIASDFGAVAQQYGVFTSDGTNCLVVGCDLTGNLTAAYAAGVNQQLLTAMGNLPNTLVNQIPGLGGVTIGNVPTQGSGTLNVASNMFKAGSSYTNP